MTRKQARKQALENQIARLNKRIVQLDNRSNRYSWIRLAIFFIGLGLSLLAFIGLNFWWGIAGVVVTLALFVIVAWYHRQIDQAIRRYRVWVYLKSAQIARMELDWGRIPEVVKVVGSDHPFEFDLDITGERSLHRLINASVSQEGSERLRSWLLQRKPDLEVIRKRQELLQELIPATLFRDKLQMKGLLASRNLNNQWEGKKLLSWLEAQGVNKALKWDLVVGSILAGMTIVLFGLNLFLGTPQLWIFSFVAYVIFFFTRSKDTGDTFEDALYLQESFVKLSNVLEFLEKYPYRSKKRLKHLCLPIAEDAEARPSSLFSRVAWITTAASLQKNPLLGLAINIVVPWAFFCAYLLDQSKDQLAQRLPQWLDIWFELEATCSLANFAYLNPDYTFPELERERQADQRITFQAVQLGHPLIPDERRVANDIALEHVGQVLLITGSNMAGKSSFLRTVGVNLCLAYAGSVVNAELLRSSLFRIFTCIKVSDSVTDGYSYFYAEVKRLRALLTELDRPDSMPLFFLVDEIFKGTNNRERLIGSSAFIRALIGKNCLGAITTHDLELVRLADSIPQISNKHFREEVIDGEMVFDYKLREGPSPTTNALKIMQLEGLPIETPDAALFVKE